MLQFLIANPPQKRIDNLPEGWVTLFMAKTAHAYPFLYVAIVGPRDTCAPEHGCQFCELGGEAKVIQFSLENVRVHDVHHGHKYIQGGGMVELDKSTTGGISWTTADECGCNEFFGVRIPPEDVLVAL